MLIADSRLQDLYPLISLTISFIWSSLTFNFIYIPTNTHQAIIIFHFTMAVSSLRPVIPFPFGTAVNKVSAEPLTTAVDRAALETSSKILDIIGRYRMKQDDNLYSHSDESTLKFIALIYTHVKAGKPVPMCLPAFPFKSPNSTSKTL